MSYKCELLRLADHTFLYITIAELVEKKPSCTMSLYYVATGQMLINWFLSAFPEEHYLRLLLTSQDLRILAAQFCTHLLAAGVLRQIPDKDVTLEPLFRVSKPLHSRSQWPRRLRRRSAAAGLLRSWVRIPPGVWMSVCCECCVLSGRGLCDELIARPEESYRLWCVVVCDLETS